MSAASPAPVPLELRDLLDRWAGAVKAKDLAALASIFCSGPEVMVFWSGGERSIGWDEVRRQIEVDFRKEVELDMEMLEPRFAPLGDGAGALTFRYRITLRMEDDSLTFTRLASMAVRRDPSGWRVAAMHVSTLPSPEGAVT